MFEGKGLFDILAMGGMTLYVLLLASCASIAVIVLKIREFMKKRVDNKAFFSKLAIKIERQSLYDSIEFCSRFDIPVINVVKEGLIYYQKTKNLLGVEAAAARRAAIEVKKLEEYTPIIATIGGVSVYIGLFGTVLGIIRSFHDISLAGSGGISVVIGGVSESLIATAAGLSVAIPAVIAYNFLTRAIDNYSVDMEYAGAFLREVLETAEKNSTIKDNKDTNENEKEQK